MKSFGNSDSSKGDSMKWVLLLALGLLPIEVAAREMDYNDQHAALAKQYTRHLKYGCTDTQAINQVELMEQGLTYSLAEIQKGKWSSQQLIRLHQTYADHALKTVNTRLLVADAYLQHKCLDEADKTYRSVLISYIGSNYVAARQRAQVGIDDVRAARRPAQ
jgi:hypothetical protein